MSTAADEIRKHARLFAAYFRFNLAAVMEYRASFLMQVFGMALNNASFIFFWRIVYTRVPAVAGYEFTDVMFIWALTSAAFGVAHALFGNCGSLGGIVIRGELDPYLLQPKDVYVNVICSRTIVSAWGDLAYGIILYLLVYGFSPGRFALFLGFVVLGGLLVASARFAAETLTFFLGNASAISKLLTEFMLSFSVYPEKIFGNSVRWMMYSLAPAGFVVFVPHRIYRSLTLANLPLLLLADLVYLFLGYMLFRAGLKRYESGNLVVTRV
jgi:ABC-2 type transport system permease protein